ncbi:alkaline phosphatase [Deinococcus psychrotolerans]|uniref:Alkaline phosphatase n=1 Tax=Deinococcus psychrotolerans TaxID=2489213 RepID=A0A3G8YLJ6_9DEIO|nr:alkaline phosphatase [Deinococcus psychrotolerans]AZI41986.1 alkaline phosphatase [Deinococcus psychrotolerans]
MKTPSLVKASLLLGTLLALSSAAAAEVKIYPYSGAHVLAGQKFDLRVEVSGVAAGAEASVMLDGKPVAGLIKTNSAADTVEYTLRGVSLLAGSHTVTVTGAATGQATMIAEAPATVAQAKKVILFIGDGMGWNTVRAAELVAHGYNPDNGMPLGRLEMETGLSGLATVTNSSYDSFLTDSANTASSIATGQKVLVNALSVYPDNTKDSLDNPRIETIAEILKRSKNMGIGLVSTAFGTDATPAAFAAHTRLRGDYSAVADQYFKGSAKPDVLLFGGSNDFISQTVPGSRRKDATNWIDDSQKMGFTFVSSRAELMKANTTKLFGLFNLSNFNSYLDRVQFKDPSVLGDFKDQPYLWDMTQKAVETLDKNPNGFFLMVEGGMIDKFEHPLDWQRGVWDVLEMDKAVAWAKDYQKTHPDTLVLVTADHAHSISTYAGYDHTKGPGNRDAVLVYQDGKFPTYSDKKDVNGIPMVTPTRGLAVGFAGVPDYCETFTARPIYKDPTISDGSGGYAPNPDICKEEGAYFRTGNLPRNTNQGVHSADPVPLFSFGPGAQNFVGMMDQTDIFFAIAKAMGVDATKDAGK